MKISTSIAYCELVAHFHFEVNYSFIHWYFFCNSKFSKRSIWNVL